MIVCPGGMPGAKHLAANRDLVRMLKEQKARGGWYAAICASPVVVFVGAGVVSTEKMVCYAHPSFTDVLRESGNLTTGKVAVSGKCITSAGPGTAIDFGLKIVECLISGSKAEEVAKELLHTL